VNILIVSNKKFPVNQKRKNRKLYFVKTFEKIIHIISSKKIDIIFIEYCNTFKLNSIKICSFLDIYYPDTSKVIVIDEKQIDSNFNKKISGININSFVFKNLNEKIIDTVSNNILKNIEYNQQLKTYANYDYLTKLANRQMFKKCLDKIIEDSNSDDKTAILFLDLDGFKNVNDNLGHNIGDEVLKIVSKRLLNTVRGSDVVVSRQGGDEFIILLKRVKNKNSVKIVAKRILNSFKKKIKIENQNINITISIGISIFPEHGKTTELLIKSADIAMYHAKNNGKNNFRFYTNHLKNKGD
jgi:diguanylate cyclase (GGDEF)-like protein